MWFAGDTPNCTCIKINGITAPHYTQALHCTSWVIISDEIYCHLIHFHMAATYCALALAWVSHMVGQLPYANLTPSPPPRFAIKQINSAFLLKLVNGQRCSGRCPLVYAKLIGPALGSFFVYSTGHQTNSIFCQIVIYNS